MALWLSICEPDHCWGVSDQEKYFGSFGAGHLAFLSTFELLLQPQLALSLGRRFPELAAMPRAVAQRYCLSLANLETGAIRVGESLVVSAPALRGDEVLATLDTLAAHGPLPLQPVALSDASSIDGAPDRVRITYAPSRYGRRKRGCW